MVSVTSGRVRWSGGQVLTAVIVAIIVAVIGSVLFGHDGVARLVALRAERQRLGEEAVGLLQENAALRDQITRLKNDDRHLETIARRDLGLVRSGEIVYRFRRPPKPPADH